MVIGSLPKRSTRRAAILQKLLVVGQMTTDCTRYGPCGLSRKWTERGLAPGPRVRVSYVFATQQQGPDPRGRTWIAIETPPGVTPPEGVTIRRSGTTCGSLTGPPAPRARKRTLTNCLFKGRRRTGPS